MDDVQGTLLPSQRSAVYPSMVARCAYMVARVLHSTHDCIYVQSMFICLVTVCCAYVVNMTRTFLARMPVHSSSPKLAMHRRTSSSLGGSLERHNTCRQK